LDQVPGSARSPPRDAAEPAGFVAVGQLPADPDRPDDVVVVADKHPAGDRHQLAGGQGDRGVDEPGAGLGSGGQASAADAHVEGAPAAEARAMRSRSRLETSSPATATSLPAASSTATVRGGKSLAVRAQGRAPQWCGRRRG